MKREIPISVVAARYRKTASRIRQLCREYDLGKLMTARCRVLSRSEAAQIGKILEKHGRNRVNKNFGKLSEKE